MDLYFLPDLIHDFFVDFNFGTLILFLVIIVLYIGISWILFDMNQLMYGKKTVIAWIPVANMYLLGELVFSKPVGYTLSGGFVLTLLLNTFVEYNLFISILTSLYDFALLGAIGYGIYRYVDIRRNRNNNSMVSNTLNLGDDNISPVKTNGPTESMINNINIIPTNNINNINSVPVQNTFIPNDNNMSVNKIENNNISDKINNIGLFNMASNNNDNVKPVQSISSEPISEKHYEMPKLILEASEKSNKKEENSKATLKNNDDEKVDKELEEEKMKFVTGVEDDDKMKFVTGEKVINSSYSNGNMVPKEEEITVVNGVISSPNDVKTEEEEKMNIVSGTIIPNQNINNNQNNNNNSILDLNKKL